MTTIPTSIPEYFIAGDTVKILLSRSDYPAPTWTLTLYLNSKDQKSAIAAVASGTDHLITITKANSALFKPGTYSYQVKVDDGTDGYTIETGRIEILPDGSQEVLDPLTIAEQNVAAIDAAINERVTEDYIEIWTEEGRKVVANNLPDLLKARNYYNGIVKAEKLKQDIANGRPTKSGKILVTFV